MRGIRSSSVSASRYPWLLIGTWVVGAGVMLGGAACDSTASAPTESESSDASLPFDHTIHAGTYELPCLSCHAFADKSPSAGIPSLRRCMQCHRFVSSDRPAIQHLSQMYSEGRAPSWPRVYDLPDHVYFSHRMHVRAELECSECHGDVARMKRVVRVNTLNMGWCMTCHRERGASIECVTCHK